MPDVEEEEDNREDEDVVHETMFTFDMFQQVRCLGSILYAEVLLPST